MIKIHNSQLKTFESGNSHAEWKKKLRLMLIILNMSPNLDQNLHLNMTQDFKVLEKTFQYLSEIKDRPVRKFVFIHI